jgi:hypothetical protein
MQLLFKRTISLLGSMALVLSGLAWQFASPAEASASQLSWKPPTLNQPITVDLKPGNQDVILDNNKDYRLRITEPLTDPGGLIVSGGRNVVLIGGEIRIPYHDQDLKRRGMYLKNQRGTIHIEGVHITGEHLGEGINLDQRYGATVQLQNMRIDTVNGTLQSNHADLIQTWAGPKTLRIDRLSGHTTYQGMFLLPKQHFPEAQLADWDFRNIDIVGTPESGYGLWKDDNHNISATNVYIHKSNGSTAKSLWPSTSVWPGVTVGSPIGASMVSGTPGMSYSSPGYVGQTAPTTTTTTTTTTAAPTTTTTNPPSTGNPPPPPPTSIPGLPGEADPDSSPRDGYWLVAADGGVFAFGDARFHGSTGGMSLNKQIVGMASTPKGNGYWLVAADGGVFAFGDARFHGSTGGKRLNKPIVGMAATPSGNGYWLVAEDGGIFSFGDAKFKGSTGSMRLNKPIVGMAARGDESDGYWLVAEDGGIFSFGDAKFKGSTGGQPLNRSIAGMAPTPSRNGYWLVAEDGGVFSFGDAGFYGSGSGSAQGRVNSLVSSDSGKGYRIQSSTGWVRSFGDAPNKGSISGALNAPVVNSSSL